MTLLDAYALVAFVADEPAAEEVEGLLRAGGTRVVVANLAEAIDVSQRVHGVAGEEVRAALEPLLDESLVPVVSEQAHAWWAADLRRRHYDRRKRALSLTDCFLLAHALEANEEIATADPPLAEAARLDGVGVVALPDRAGERP